MKIFFTQNLDCFQIVYIFVLSIRRYDVSDIWGQPAYEIAAQAISVIKSKIKKTTVMAKQILLPTEIRTQMATTFKVTRAVLDRALGYRGNSSRDRMLRAAALERGGVIYLGERVANGFMPAVDTVGGGRVLVQRLTDRVVLRINRDSDSVSLLVDGQEVMARDGVTLRQWGDILYSLRHLYDRLNA